MLVALGGAAWRWLALDGRLLTVASTRGVGSGGE